MKSNFINIASILFVASIAFYFGTVFDGKIRTVEFVSILAIGVFLGVMLTLFLSRKKENQSDIKFE